MVFNDEDVHGSVAAAAKSPGERRAFLQKRITTTLWMPRGEWSERNGIRKRGSARALARLKFLRNFSRK
jgi:hypothetical protein